MTTTSKSAPIQQADKIWIPFGFVLGSTLGAYFSDGAMGMSLGILAGAAVAMIVDYRNGIRGITWPLVGIFAFLWTAALYLIERL